ncbi:hypothetical protein E2C01_015221 [Portunus trituberculatus]|uniref:Uncharacterized protein n=1 Tax=Portunus trituberculatus TaxID=210409 RepID=A0A5B7DM86_PORTR|nr:hypothetical protein [Portunus trituberculatus]
MHKDQHQPPVTREGTLSKAAKACYHHTHHKTRTKKDSPVQHLLPPGTCQHSAQHNRHCITVFYTPLANGVGAPTPPDRVRISPEGGMERVMREALMESRSSCEGSSSSRNLASGNASFHCS